MCKEGDEGGGMSDERRWLVSDDMKIMFSMESVSSYSAFEFFFADGLVDGDVFIGPDGDVSVGIELYRFYWVNMTHSFLLFIIGKLS